MAYYINSNLHSSSLYRPQGFISEFENVSRNITIEILFELCREPDITSSELSFKAVTFQIPECQLHITYNICLLLVSCKSCDS